jgi:hypothetical protein
MKRFLMRKCSKEIRSLIGRFPNFHWNKASEQTDTYVCNGNVEEMVDGGKSVTSEEHESVGLAYSVSGSNTNNN